MDAFLGPSTLWVLGPRGLVRVYSDVSTFCLRVQVPNMKHIPQTITTAHELELPDSLYHGAVDPSSLRAEGPSTNVLGTRDFYIQGILNMAWAKGSLLQYCHLEFSELGYLASGCVQLCKNTADGTIQQCNNHIKCGNPTPRGYWKAP